MFATRIQRSVYRWVLKPIFFRYDPEVIHDFISGVLRRLGRVPGLRQIVGFLWSYKNSALEQSVLGITFPNPVGLAAGFDKNGLLLNILSGLGFGFAEIGSITGEPCVGNPKPRLWRLPKSQGLVVNYGLKNDGCEAIGARLRGKKFTIPFGTSVAKTNSPATVTCEAGVEDYAKAFRTLADIGDYFTVNISCPNAFGGEPFSDPDRLEVLLEVLDKIPTKKPVFLKFGADLTIEQVDALTTIAEKHRVHGFVLTNLTKKRDRQTIIQSELVPVGNGGISGVPVRDPSTDLIAHLYRRYGKKYVLIGVGGIFSAQDAYDKIRAGASLVQLMTGMIFEGPTLIGEINRGLIALLKQDGFSHISDAIGTRV